MDVPRIIRKANTGLDELFACRCRNIARDHQFPKPAVCLPDYCIYNTSAQIRSLDLYGEPVHPARRLEFNDSVICTACGFLPRNKPQLPHERKRCNMRKGGIRV